MTLNLTAYIALCLLFLFVIAYAAYERGRKDERELWEEDAE